ncbi:MAG: phage tail assembly protein [Symploca sp. SIO2C1]|nr:phage tail assembly protein [Symploca sp. SIO2C1]
MCYTEFEFILPKGLVDPEGEIHRQGTMRLATGKDVMYVQRSRQVLEEPEYGVLVILSRVITRIGNLSSVSPELLEQLFLVDFAYLQKFFHHINGELSSSGAL